VIANWHSIRGTVTSKSWLCKTTQPHDVAGMIDVDGTNYVKRSAEDVDSADVAAADNEDTDDLKTDKADGALQECAKAVQRAEVG